LTGPAVGSNARTDGPMSTPAMSSPRTAGWPMRSASSPSTFAPTRMAMIVRKKCSVRIPSEVADDPRRSPSASRPAMRPVHRLPLRLRAIDDLLDEEVYGLPAGDLICLCLGTILAAAADGRLL